VTTRGPGVLLFVELVTATPPAALRVVTGDQNTGQHQHLDSE